MTQQKRQVGIMKAIGADDQQISGMYFVLLGLFGVISFLIAVPLGCLAGLRQSDDDHAEYQ